MNHFVFLSILLLGLSILLNSCGPDQPADLSTFEGINRTLVKNPRDTAALYARANHYLARKNLDSALLDMQALLQLDSTNAAYYITLGDIYLFGNRTRYTRQAFEKAIQLSPASEEAHMKLAELFLYVEMHQESLNELNEVLRINKHHPKAYYMKGMVYKEGKDTALAISSFLTTTEQDPEYALAYEQLGLIYAARRDPRALDFYRNALRINPKNTLVQYNIGLFYQENGEPDKAIELYKELLVTDPSYAYAHYNIGYIFYELKKKPAEALPHFEQALNAKPDYAEARYMTGLCKEDLGKRNEAIADYRASLQLNPELELARHALARLGAPEKVR